MRCMALAETFDQMGHEIAFAVAASTLDAIPCTLPSRWKTVVVSGDADREPEELAGMASATDANLIVDHYGRDRRFETRCRSWAKRIVVFEDMPVRMHDCDILLDAAGAGRRNEYGSLVPNECRMLLGPQFAPLRRQFLN